MDIVIGCDPNAESLKKEIIQLLEELGHKVTDMGSDDPVYANVAARTARAVAKGEYDRGILICGTGIGVSIAANKIKGAYCALVNNIYQAQRAQLSNNANLIAIGSQVTGTELAKSLVTEYLSHTFDPESRSKIKVDRILELEDE